MVKIFQCRFLFRVFQALGVPNLKANLLKSVIPDLHYMHADMLVVHVGELYLPETMRKLCLSTKFAHQEIR